MRIALKPRPLGLATVIALSLAFGAFLAASPTPAYALTNCTVSDLTIDTEEKAFLTLINNYRASNGKPALTISTNLNRAAIWMSGDMATKNYFSHTDSLGRSPSTRVQQCGFPGGAGENIAAGTVRDTAQEVFDAWKASSGHNTNMLNSSYKQIGIARHYNGTSQYKWYWTTDFSLVSDGTNALGGGSTTPPPATGTSASMTSPSPGSLLGNTATFNWSAGSGALEYHLYVGTSQGSSNIKNISTGTSRSTTVTNLAASSGTRTVYVRLYTRLGGGWQYRDYTYTAKK